MTFLGSLIGTDVPGLFLMFTNEGVSFGLYDIARSLTIPGWGVIITLLIESVYMIAVGIERWLISMRPSISAISTRIRTLRWLCRPV